MKSKKGFTLIEVLAVLVILSILITFSVVSVSKIKKRQEIENRINVIRSILTAARAYEADNPNETDNPNENGVEIQTLLDENYVDFDTKKYDDLLILGSENRKIIWSNKYYEDRNVKESNKLSFVFEGYIDIEVDSKRLISDCGQETEQQNDKVGKVLCEGDITYNEEFEIFYYPKCKKNSTTGITICAGWDSKGKYYDTAGNQENGNNLKFN